MAASAVLAVQGCTARVLFGHLSICLARNQRAHQELDRESADDYREFFHAVKK
jgi:hypothetical protein